MVRVPTARCFTWKCTRARYDRMARPGIAALTALIATPFLAPLPAGAHAFGQRYDLPLPLWLYASGAGAVVALSFAVMALVLHSRRSDPESLYVDVLSLAGLRWLGHPCVVTTVRALSVGLFGLILAACFFGDPGPFDNVAPTFVWVIWWVGLAFLSALFGNLWDLLNPWVNLFRWGERLSGGPPRRRPYPAWLGQWPAVVLFFAFVWMELVFEGAEKPRALGVLILIYSVITWLGMARFGRAAWLRHGEAFSVAFGVLARFAPLHGTGREAAGNGDGEADGPGRALRLRFPAAGLLVPAPMPVSYVCFVILLLTSVTFDGILETPFWQSVLAWVSESTALRGALVYLQQAGVDLLVLIETLALAIAYLVFIGGYAAVSWLIGAAGSERRALRDLAGYFVLSLVPIAIAYHLSHYLSYLLIAGQNIIPLASDPFGIGWDLFGTRAYRLDIGVVSAKMIWYVAVTAIVLGHVIAVWLAHVMALRVFSTRRQALFSQLPMLVLMVAYTMISLWILSQPIVA